MPDEVDPVEAPLVATRRALHAVAEHVLAADLHARTGRIGLRVVPGGFATPVGDDGRQVAVAGTDLVVADADGRRSTPLATVAEAAAFAGVEPGGPGEVYHLPTPLEPDAPLAVDPEAAARLAAAWAVGRAALERILAARGLDAEPVLWPEHFDVAVTVDEVNLGVSPGDDEHAEPYAYVGPWDRPEPGGFWNEPFGASIPVGPLATVDDVVTFLEDGLRRAAERRGT